MVVPLTCHVRLSISDRREAVKELTADGLSQRAAGEVVGVHHRTVERDQAAANAAEASDFSEENGKPEGTPAANAAPRPPIPEGSKTPHEEAANDPGVRWYRSIHDLYVLLNSVRELGVEQFIGGHIRLSIGDRREAVKELTADGLSQREVGEVLGVDHVTVANDLRAGENSPGADDSLGKNGQAEETPGENSPRPPIPKGSKTPHEEAANDPGVRWHRSIHDLYVLINSVRDLGGIEKVARKWGKKTRRQTAAELKRIVARLQDYITYFSEGGCQMAGAAYACEDLTERFTRAVAGQDWASMEVLIGTSA
jgi:transposase